MTELVGVILANNEEHNIEACIDTLRWTDEVIVFESYSTDRTVEVAEQAGARVIQHHFENFGAQREAALHAVDAEWIFFVDADERATPALAEEIRAKIERSERGWWVPRDNYIFGKLTRGAGWYPDYQLRLLHRTSARYDLTRTVHELVILDGEAGHLENPLTHYNYQTVEQFFKKQRYYTQFEAKRRYDEGQRTKPWTYLTMPTRHFWWRFITERGYIDRLHGLRLSLFMAYYEFLTYRQVARLAREEDR
ncbi:MAG: glycosyltransferase family 2 protein [Anaerolineae bacterium]|nr:glycosyltransferase family 2 protein [Anaerolineae bacterium]